MEEKAEVMFGTEWEARVIERFCRSMKRINLVTKIEALLGLRKSPSWF